MNATTKRAEIITNPQPPRPRMSRLFLRPRETWAAFAEAPPSGTAAFFRYAVPLAAIPAIAKGLGLLLFGINVYGVLFRPAPAMVIGASVLAYVVSLISVFALALFIDAFSAVFNGERGFGRAMMLSVFTHAPGWIGGVVAILPAMGAVPPLGVLTVALNVYGLYLLYLGIGPVMRVGKDRAPAYASLAIIVFLALWGASSLARTAFERTVMVPSPGATLHSGDADIDVAKLQKAAQELRKAMNSDAAPKPAATTDELESLLPGDLANGFVRTQRTSSSTHIGKLKASTARGTYQKDKAVFTLTVSDVGSIGGLTSAITLKANRNWDTGYEKSGEVDGRLTIEKYDRPSNTGEYDVLVGNRFLVQAKGAAAVEVLKEAAHALDFGRIEAMAAG